MEMSNRDKLLDAAQGVESITTKPMTPMREDELWRCYVCRGCIRTNHDIRKGMMCKKCGSNRVVPAFPTWWETVTLFFRTGKIYVMERKRGK